MNTRRILCVQTGPQIDELRGVLEGDGFEVLGAGDARKAMDVLSSQQVDGVILNFDLAAPGGGALRNRILHDRPGMPMLLFRNVEELQKLALRVFRACLSTPEEPGTVLAHLNN